MKYYLNGECIAYAKLNLSKPKFLCANLAVPDNKGPFHPGPNTSIIHSGNYEIDYIRIWASDKSKENKIDVATYNPKLNSDNLILRTQLKSKTRFYYGSTSDHKNEGITVSIFPDVKNNYIIRVLRKEIPNDAIYKITDSNNSLRLSGNLKYGSNIIDLNTLTGNDFELIIRSYNHTVSYHLKRFD